MQLGTDFGRMCTLPCRNAIIYQQPSHCWPISVTGLRVVEASEVRLAFLLRIHMLLHRYVFNDLPRRSIPLALAQLEQHVEYALGILPYRGVEVLVGDPLLDIWHGSDNFLHKVEGHIPVRAVSTVRDASKPFTDMSVK